MSLQRLMQKLADNQVEVWLEHDKLRYRAPKQAMTEELMTDLKTNKQALIEYFQIQSQQPFVLTYGQRALWFLHQTVPHSSAYNLAFAARVLSVVDVDRMNQALSYLIKRHPALRLRFQENDGEPEQSISSDITPDFQVVDGDGWDDDTLQAHFQSGYHTPFNLSNQESLFRVRLFKRSSHQSVLLIVFHHIIGDGWSLWLLLDELAKVYSSLVSGHQPQLPTLPISYRQFAEQQVAKVDSGQLEDDWRYWRDKFAQTPPLLNLPCKRPFPVKRSYQGASYPLRVNSTTLAMLKTLAAETGVTLYIVLLAAYQLLLHRCSGQQQLCVGTPLAGRDDDRYASVVGYFVNPLPLLSEIQSGQSVTDFIQACSREVLSAMAHQEFPLALVMERLSLSRDSSRPPLFQAAFLFQQLQKSQQILDLNSSDHTAEKTMDWGGLTLAPYTLFQQEGQFDLALELIEAGGDLIGSLKFNTDVMDVDDAQRLVDYYLNILMNLGRLKTARLASIPLLNHDFEHTIIRTWNATDYTYAPDLVPTLLSRQAQQTPQAIALVYEQSELSYAE
nr:hypothetical protein [Gammaproteobacteria bacterium]